MVFYLMAFFDDLLLKMAFGHLQVSCNVLLNIYFQNVDDWWIVYYSTSEVLFWVEF